MLKDIIENHMKNKKLEYSIFIKNLNDGRVCSFNEKEVVPSASIIKLFIMAKAFELSDRGEIDLKKRITVVKENRVPYSIVYILDDDNTYTIKDLITLMIIQSDNTATNQLITILGMDNINKFVKDLGFKDTIVQRKMMDYKARAAGRENYTTAEEVGKLLELMYNGQLVSSVCSHEMLEIMKNQLDASMMRISLEDELIVAHKTGDLQNIKHDAGIVYLKNNPYIFTMMTWNAESDSYARNIIGEVSNITYDYMTLQEKDYAK